MDVWSYECVCVCVCVMYECSTARPLILPMHGNGSSKHTVPVWCRDWQSLAGPGRSSVRQFYPGNDAQRLHCRLLRAACLAPHDAVSESWSVAREEYWSTEHAKTLLDLKANAFEQNWVGNLLFGVCELACSKRVKESFLCFNIQIDHKSTEVPQKARQVYGT